MKKLLGLALIVSALAGAGYVAYRQEWLPVGDRAAPAAIEPHARPASDPAGTGSGEAPPATAAPQPVPGAGSPAAADSGAWVLEIDTQGGFTGKGAGRVRITSEGAVVATRFATITLHPCRTERSRTDMEKIQQAVASAEPSAWKPRYAPDGDNGCCDRFRWALKLDRIKIDGTEHTYTTFWYDRNEQLLPTDVAVLHAVAWELKSDALVSCGQ